MKRDDPDRRNAGFPRTGGEMGALVRNFDWAATPLGPIETWSADLKLATSLVLDNAFPAALIWGPGLVTIYNDGFRPILGAKPEALGRSFADIWSEAWHEIGPIAERALAGQSTFIEDYPLVINRAGVPEQAFFTFSYSPVRTADGSVVGIIDTVLETTDKIRAGKVLREREKQFHALVHASSDVVYRMSPDWSEMRHLVGRDFVADTENPSTTWLDKYIHPEDQPQVRQSIDASIASRSVFELEHRVIRVDGSLGWTHSRAVPLLDEHGAIVEWIGMASDVTARREAEEALRDSEERFRQFGEASSDVLWIRNADTLQWEYLTPAFEAIYGQTREAALGGNDFRSWTDMILPEDRKEAMAGIERVRSGERVTFEYRIRRPSDGEVRWLRDTDFPLLDEIGRVVRIGGIGQDVTEEKHTAEHLQVLVAELQHRTRNLISVVRSLSDRTLVRSDSLQDFRDRFRERLAALARVNSMLSRLDEGRKVTFDEVLRAELAAHGAVDEEGHGRQVTLEGPAGIELRSATVQIFALALHELATNAGKYGALANAEGQLSVRWRVEADGGEPHLHVEWKESGVGSIAAADAAPQGGGYGRELIEKALPYQLKAKTSFEMEPDGVRCRIVLPLRA